MIGQYLVAGLSIRAVKKKEASERVKAVFFEASRT